MTEQTTGAGPSGILLRIAYDGRRFSGFALQPGQRTIAGELLGAVQSVDPRVKEVRGASRTDAGVHAFDQCVAFDPERSLPPSAWAHLVSRALPEEISVRSAENVASGFVPRFRAVEKTYRYSVLADDRRDPFHEGRSWRVKDLELDRAVPPMQAEAAALLGTHDFAAFRSAQDERTNTTRTIARTALFVDPVDPRRLLIDVTGSGFLHNMVRIIVGALVDVGRGRLQPGAVARGLATLDRRQLGITAPPDGLCLLKTVLDLTAAEEPTAAGDSADHSSTA